MSDVAVAEDTEDLEEAPSRTRPRRMLFGMTEERRTDIAERVITFFDQHMSDRSADRDARLQRYAKFRMWTEGKNWPWPNCSDLGLPDMMEKSLRVQDTLHNAVMSTRPAIGATAISGTSPDKERHIDQLHDYQFFVEQPGETIVGELADAFVNDGVCIAFTPWITEERDVVETRIFDPIPADLAPRQYFQQLLNQTFPNHQAEEDGRSNGWDWRLSRDGERFRVSFYTSETDEVEMVARRDVVVYDGPRCIPMAYEDVLYPARAANLQIPSPSNPNGAANVILVLRPTIDEIKRLAKQKYYDLLTEEEIDSLVNVQRSGADEEEKKQEDVLQGQSDEGPERLEAGADQRTLTLLLCFDLMDIDGDGRAEDVVWWVLKESRLTIRARLLTEFNPSDPPRRPLDGASFIPVKDRFAGISLLELIESIHDAMKSAYDQMVDAGTIATVPFGAYRPTSSMRPETYRFEPGVMIPLANPATDLSFPQMNNNAQAFGINLLTLLQTMEERTLVIGDLQFGRVPPGRSSALRTTGNAALLLGQGEARPERMLRRFFGCLTGIWRQMHQLNQRMLPPEKKVRLMGIPKPGQEPYITIQRQELRGSFDYSFDANALNTSKAQLQQSMTAMLQVFVSQLAIQLGISDAETVFRLMNDFGKAFGINAPEKGYIKPPVPGADQPRIFAEEALAAILRDEVPQGVPAEGGGATEHLAKLTSFVDRPEFGLLTPEQVQIFRAYIEQTAERAAFEQRQAAIQAGATELQRSLGGNGSGGPEGQPQAPGPGPFVSGSNELLDETLPSAGGGAVQ